MDRRDPSISEKNDLIVETTKKIIKRYFVTFTVSRIVTRRHLKDDFKVYRN